jgi:hypothetical protein
MFHELYGSYGIENKRLSNLIYLTTHLQLNLNSFHSTYEISHLLFMPCLVSGIRRQLNEHRSAVFSHYTVCVTTEMY